mmetsp:Transcript_64234/g.73956  ORF Transcript_64234/g.73956 Transcript_64234/m.73956 type:complete len:569 (+) Transcript_64234:210-1916(+)
MSFRDLPNLESRPLSRDNKKLSLLKRWTSHGITFTGIRRHNDQHTQNSSNTTTNTATMVDSSSFSFVRALSRSNHKLLTHINHHHHNDSQINTIDYNCQHIHHMLPSSSSTPFNIMHWMQNDCPKDVLPLILAFVGPQKMAVIGRTNHFWRQILEQESTWRRLCEELYKWKEGDLIPESWKKYYQYNPCVPVDYSTVHGALSVIEKAKVDSLQPSVVRILLRPGRYILREAITIDEARDSVSVEIETMEYYPNTFHGSGIECSLIQPTEQSKRKRKSSIRSLFQCRTVDVEDDDDEHYMIETNYLYQSEEDPVVPTDLLVENRRPSRGDKENNRNCRNMNNTVVKQATLVLRTRRHNEPLIRVRQGSCTIRNIEMKHISHGTDIWNGNACIQIQPPIGLDDEPRDVTPVVTLDRVDVTSSSGRGIVNIDGGHAKIINSCIHDCAATGIYVGGPGSRTMIEQSDVLHNGKGNPHHRRGIARGHSGIYLEQGHASIIDCNISKNSLTGISAISPENALLSLLDSELVSNGTLQLEMPAIGTVAHRNSVTLNNIFASTGMGRSRSGLAVET